MPDDSARFHASDAVPGDDRAPLHPVACIEREYTLRTAAMNPLFKLFVKGHVWLYRSSGEPGGACRAAQGTFALQPAWRPRLFSRPPRPAQCS
jgi:hypothetical protein